MSLLGGPPRFSQGEASSWHQAGSKDLFRHEWLLKQHGHRLRPLTYTAPFQGSVLGAVWHLRAALGSAGSPVPVPPCSFPFPAAGPEASSAFPQAPGCSGSSGPDTLCCQSTRWGLETSTGPSTAIPDTKVPLAGTLTSPPHAHGPEGCMGTVAISCCSRWIST